MGESCGMHAEGKHLAGKPKGHVSLVRSRCRWGIILNQIS